MCKMSDYIERYELHICRAKTTVHNEGDSMIKIRVFQWQIFNNLIIKDAASFV